MKCDEAKPFCRRCQKGGFVCRGFTVVGPKHCTIFCSLPTLPLIEQDATRQEREYNHYFCTAFITSFLDESNRVLFAEHLPQAAQHRAPIWHACNAIAAIHRRQLTIYNATMTAEHYSEKMYRDSLRQYSASLDHLSRLAKRLNLTLDDKTTILLSNMLFCIYSIHQNDLKSSSTLILNTISLIRQWRFWKHPEFADGYVTRILLFFVNFEGLLQDMQLVSAQLSWNWAEAVSYLELLPLPSFENACVRLEMLWNGLRAVLQLLRVNSSPDEVRRINMARRTFSTHLEAFSAAFRKLKSLSNRTAIHHDFVKMIEMRRILVRVLLKVDISGFETCWDEFEVDFETAILLMDQLLSTRGLQVMLPSLRANLIKSLHFLICVYRRSAPRRKMIELLRRNMRDFLAVPSQCVAPLFYSRVLEVIVQLEEGDDTGRESCDCMPSFDRGGYICNNHRVTEFSAIFHPGKTEEVVLRTVGDTLNHRPARRINCKGS